MIGMKYENLVQDLKYIIPTKQQFLVPPSFRGEDCFQYFSQSETELPMATMFFVQLG